MMLKFAKQPVLQFTLRELTQVLKNSRLWMAFGLVLALFALVGPFGTYEALSFPARLGYWTITQVVTWSIALSVISLTGAIAGRSPFDNLRMILIGAGLASIPIAIAVEIIGHLVFGRPITLSGTGVQVLLTLPVSLLLGFLAYLVVGSEKAPQSPAPQTGDKLIKRLSPAKRGEILYLSMRDHYVEVVTRKGRELILLRFREALDEVEGADGLQIHRSHWVSRNAIRGSRNENGKLLLELVDGTKLPVSRSYRKALRGSGMLETQ